MLKREIKYEDFNGNPRTETHYFNFSKREAIEFQIEERDLFDLDMDIEKAGIEDVVKEMGKSINEKKLVKLIKFFILNAYGIKSDDGRRFEKNEAIREDFANSAAYNKLWEELAFDDGKAATFVQGVFPKEMSGDIDKAVKEARAVQDAQAPALQEVPQPPRPPS